MTTLDLASPDQTTDFSPNLQLDILVQDLYTREGLVKIDRAFLDFLGDSDAALCEKLSQARENPELLLAKDESTLLIEIAPWLEDFIARLFNIETEVKTLATKHHELGTALFLQTAICTTSCQR